MGETPKDPIDELVRRSMKDAPGAPASFRSRITAQVAAEQQQARRAKLIRIQAAVAVAGVIVLALVIGLNIDLFLPKQQPDPQPQARANANAQPTQDAGEEAPDQPEPQPEDQPEDQPKPQPEPEDEPNVTDQVEQPEPEPEDQPEPQPGPKPEPKPEDVVEEPQPEPKQEDVVKEPEPTETDPTPTRTHTDMGRLLSTADVEWRIAPGEWQELAPGSKVQTGWQLRAGRDPVDVALDRGGQIRFDGELEIDESEQGYAFKLIEDGLYVDNLGTERGVTISFETLQAGITDGAGFFEIDRGGLNAACIHGDLTLEGESVGEGKQRRATERGVQGEKDFRGDRLLDELPARVLVRYDFDEAPPGGMYEDGERLEDGVAVMDQAPRYIAFRHDQTLKVLPGTVVRIRLRATNVSRLELEQFTPDNALMFKHTWAPEKDGEWIEVELRLEDIAEYENPERHIQPGDLLRNFKLHYVGDKLELDRVEFARVQS